MRSQPQFYETTNLLVVGEGQRALVSLVRFIAAIKATKHVGACQMERRVVFESTGPFDPIE